MSSYIYVNSPCNYQVQSPSGIGTLVYIGIQSTPDAPTNPIARNIGNGSLEVEWASLGLAGFDFDHCDVYLSTTLSGTYTKANKKKILSNRTILSNLPFGQTVYVKVTVTDMSGVESVMSVAADDGYCIRATCQLTFTGPAADQIPIGAMFAEFVGDGHLVAWKTLASGLLT